MRILVTGAAGFIGMHVARLLLERGDEVVGIDNLNDYYDPRLKAARLEHLAPFANFRFVRMDVADTAAITELFAAERFQRVIHLAAQAGVRYSLTNPQAYIQSNLVGFGNILEGCRHNAVEHLVYASSSSVYGANTRMPFSVHDEVNHPVSLYAATKKSNELMAHSYSHLFGLPTTGLRYFTVYGPWGRPDMSPWLFSSAILEGRSIDVFNHGKMRRDFTFVDDIAEGTVRVMDHVASGNADFNPNHPDPGSSRAPYRRTVAARLAHAFKTNPGRTEFVRVQLSQENGEFVAAPTGSQSSVVLLSMARADGFMVVPADCAGLAAGEQVTVQLFDSAVLQDNMGFRE